MIHLYAFNVSIYITNNYDSALSYIFELFECMVLMKLHVHTNAAPAIKA